MKFPDWAYHLVGRLTPEEKAARDEQKARMAEELGFLQELAAAVLKSAADEPTNLGDAEHSE